MTVTFNLRNSDKMCVFSNDLLVVTDYVKSLLRKRGRKGERERGKGV